MHYWTRCLQRRTHETKGGDNVQDVPIAKMALLNELALVTADPWLAEVMRMFGGTLVTP
jgi:predicted nucleic acid-binding protein